MAGIESRIGEVDYVNLPEKFYAHIDLDFQCFLKHCTRRDYGRNHLIIRQGSRADKLYFLRSGSVSIIREDSAGNELVLTYLRAGSFFGELGLFDVLPSSASVRAREPSQVAQISHEKFLQLAGEMPDLMKIVAAQLAYRVRFTSQKVVSLAYTDVSGRVARVLLDMSKNPDYRDPEDNAYLKVTRKEIGRHAGCSREQVGRVLKQFELQGLISLIGNRIQVHEQQLKGTKEEL